MLEGLDDDNSVEINGRFRLQQSTDYEKFLAFQGAPWPIRKAIMLDTGTVSIVETTHERVKFQQIGLVRQSFELEFDSDPVEHVMRIARRKFLDSAHKIKNGFRFVRKDLSTGNETIIDRTLRDDVLTVKYTATKENGESISASQIYVKIDGDLVNECDQSSGDSEPEQLDDEVT